MGEQNAYTRVPKMPQRTTALGITTCVQMSTIEPSSPAKRGWRDSWCPSSSASTANARAAAGKSACVRGPHGSAA